jgi:hypothetical protein
MAEVLGRSGVGQQHRRIQTVSAKRGHHVVCAGAVVPSSVVETGGRRTTLSARWIDLDTTRIDPGRQRSGRVIWASEDPLARLCPSRPMIAARSMVAANVSPG